MKLQFGSTCFITVFHKDRSTRKYARVLDRHKAKGCVLIGEPRSMSVGNGRNAEISIFLEPSQSFKLESSKDVAYVEVHGNFLMD